MAGRLGPSRQAQHREEETGLPVRELVAHSGETFPKLNKEL